MSTKPRQKSWVIDLAKFLDAHPTKVFSREDLNDLIGNQGSEIGIPESLRVTRLISVLVEESDLEVIKVRRDGKGPGVETKTRYGWGDVSPYAIGASLQRNAYLSHASAMFLHALTDQVPKTIYVNKEQSPKPWAQGTLSQSGINLAFKRPPRTSAYAFIAKGARFVFLSGKHTGRLEVSPIRTPREELVDATKLERTLIDIVVRPAYAGGTREVLEAYRRATPRLSINTLLATLKKLDYVYPYHQAIGFLLEQAGVPNTQLAKFESLGVEWDFFLAHKMADPVFNSRWRIFHPKGI